MARTTFDLMSKARHILAVVAVATALCADQAIAAAPLPKTQVAEMAARFVERLSQPFRRTVPSAVRPLNSTRTVLGRPVLPPACVVVEVVRNCEFSPFQFRLPPPII
jgi:hypothetical protein